MQQGDGRLLGHCGRRADEAAPGRVPHASKPSHSTPHPCAAAPAAARPAARSHLRGHVHQVTQQRLVLFRGLGQLRQAAAHLGDDLAKAAQMGATEGGGAAEREARRAEASRGGAAAGGRAGLGCQLQCTFGKAQQGRCGARRWAAGGCSTGARRHFHPLRLTRKWTGPWGEMSRNASACSSS